jgi:hypothetical protein
MKCFRLCIGIAPLLLMSCSDQKLDAGAWSPAQEVASSSDTLFSSFTLYRWNDSLLTLGGDDGSRSARVLEADSGNWKTISTNDLGGLPSSVDPHGTGMVMGRATLLIHTVESQFTAGSLTPDVGFNPSGAVPLLLEQTTLFPKAPPNLEINYNELPGLVRFSGGVMDGLEIRIPHSITGTPIERKGKQVGIRGDLAVSANGVFASSDGGRTWRIELIAQQWSLAPVVCRTKAYYYYFAVTGLGGIEPFQLWYSRCAVESASWSGPVTLNKSVARKFGPGLRPIAEKDTLHLCWLDARHEKFRTLNFTLPCVENYEVAYCRRKDSDQSWSKDVILSKGLRWAYSPSMSVEGEKLVVAWAGAKSDREGRNELNASDIYYVTSKDGGGTWTKPVQVTDGFKQGITSGRPQVALYKGMIHLIYIQRKSNDKEVSAGMGQHNQQSWPIYYQWRAFPE